MSIRLMAASALILSTLVPGAARACSACGCNLDTSEEPSESTSRSGLSVDERIDYINQNSLWLGAGKAPPQDATRVEVQKKTTTVFATTTFDYAAADPWGVSVAIPFEYRFHVTYNDTNDPTVPQKSAWTALSDIRVLGRYSGLTEGRNFSVLGGMKLPTGSTGKTFDGGTNAGTLVDAGLQPGSGTWDLLLGLGQTARIADGIDVFAQELWQKPINQHSDFRLGQTLNASVGVRYQLSETFVPQLQFNAQNRWRDTGANADRINSGGEVIYASPGLFVNLPDDTAVYGFVQLPVYQRVGGLELVPNYSASVGIKHRF